LHIFDDTLSCSSLFAAGTTLGGIEAPGHIAEETKNARYGI
jgi:translation initiation factor 5B